MMVLPHSGINEGNNSQACCKKHAPIETECLKLFAGRFYLIDIKVKIEFL